MNKYLAKNIFFALIWLCIIWILIEFSILSVLYFRYKTLNPFLRDDPLIPSQVIIKRLTNLIMPSKNISGMGGQFFLEQGNLEKIYSDDKYREMIERIYGQNIDTIRNLRNEYQKEIFSYRPNFLDHLITSPPNGTPSEDALIAVNEYGGRSGIDNKSREMCWIFGGSTVWGDMLPGEQTISSYLNSIQSEIKFINYGIPGYHSNSELKYLIFNLKTQKNPKCVIWLDGLNDATNIIQYPTVRSWDSTSHAQRFQLSPYQQKKIFNSEKVDLYDFLLRTENATKYLETLQKYDLVTMNELNTSLKKAIFNDEVSLKGTEKIFSEAALNHMQNAMIARAIVQNYAKSSFFGLYSPMENKTSKTLSCCLATLNQIYILPQPLTIES